MTKQKIKLYIILIGLALILLLYLLLAYAKTKDVSNQANFVTYIGKPIVIKTPGTLVWRDQQLRFNNHALNVNDTSTYTSESLKTIKKYTAGDTIYFYKAMSYKSIHVGTTYYLLGKDTLDSGEVIDYEYYANFDYTPAIWENLDDFLARRKKEE